MIWQNSQLERIEQLLKSVVADIQTLKKDGVKIMSVESDLQADLDTIKANVATVLTKVTAQAATIAELQAQVAAGTPVSQAQLDALDAEAKAIVASFPA